MRANRLHRVRRSAVRGVSVVAAVSVTLLPAAAFAGDLLVSTNTTQSSSTLTEDLGSMTGDAGTDVETVSGTTEATTTATATGDLSGTDDVGTGDTAGTDELDPIVGQLLELIGQDEDPPSEEGGDGAGSTPDEDGSANPGTGDPSEDSTRQASTPGPAPAPPLTHDPAQEVEEKPTTSAPSARRASAEQLAAAATASLTASAVDDQGPLQTTTGRLGGPLEGGGEAARPAVRPLLDAYLFSPISVHSSADRSGPRSTHQLLLDLQALRAPISVIVSILRPFPVVGPASYTDDWHAPRSVPTPHLHQGVDIFAPTGTPVVAVADGTVTRIWFDSRVGGNAVQLTTEDGTYFYYAHLDRIFDAVRQGQQVNMGDLLGYVGATGNAVGTPPHLHFEIHPQGGKAVPPIPVLDRWLEEARERAEAYGTSQGAIAPPVVAPAATAGGATSTSDGIGAAASSTSDRVVVTNETVRGQAASSGPAGSGTAVAFGVIAILAGRAFRVRREATSGPVANEVDDAPLPIEPLITWDTSVREFATPNAR